MNFTESLVIIALATSIPIKGAVIDSHNTLSLRPCKFTLNEVSALSNVNSVENFAVIQLNLNSFFLSNASNSFADFLVICRERVAVIFFLVLQEENKISAKLKHKSARKKEERIILSGIADLFI